MKDSPLSRLLLEVPWQYYVTLTFGANWNDKRSRNKMERVYKWLRLVSGHHRGNKKLRTWRWLIAEEFGEAGGRFHVHILLADLGPATRSHCHAMMWLWKEMGGGWAVIRPFDRSLSGVGYCLKSCTASSARQLSEKLAQAPSKSKASAKRTVSDSLAGQTLSSAWNVSDANAYEVGKVGKGEGSLGESTVTLSSVLLTFLVGLESGKASRSLTRRGKLDKFRPWL